MEVMNSPTDTSEPAAMTRAETQELKPSTHQSCASPLEFTGSGGEYFRIWIVNLCLTVITAGIYYAWATVRTRKYFHQNTKLFGHGFDFHAKPEAILRSRFITLVVCAGAFVLTGMSQAMAIGVTVVFYLATPVLVLLALQFGMANTSYRGIRFRFVGNIREAYLIYLGLPLLTLLSLGIAIPYASYRSRRFWVSGTRFGTTRAETGISLSVVAHIYILPMACAAIGLFALVLVPQQDSLSKLWPLAFLPGFFIARAYLNARILRHVFESTRIGIVRFECRYTFRGFLWMNLSNLLMIALSFGLLLPFAKVRKAQYLATNLTAIADAPLDEFIAGAIQRPTASGDEFADSLGIDVPAIG